MSIKQSCVVGAGFVLAIGLFVTASVSAGEGCGCANVTTDAYIDEYSIGGTCEKPVPASEGVGYDKMPPVGTKTTCPVSGNEFSVTKETPSSVFKGKTYVFFCPYCKAQFDKNPEKYLK